MINLCIVDDDKELADQMYHVITEYLASRKMIFSVDVYYSGESFLEYVSQAEFHYHICFLDIIMQGKNGIQIAKELRKHNRTVHIIFLTSSPEYALEGYEVRAYNYMLKPLQIEKLYETLSELLGAENPHSVKQLQITNSGVVRNIPYHNIVYMEVRRNKLLVVLNTGEKVETYSTITEMVSLLKGEEIFTRTHRSFLINMQYIKEFTSSKIRLQPEYEIPVSRTYSAAVKQDYLAFAKAFFS